MDIAGQGPNDLHRRFRRPTPEHQGLAGPLEPGNPKQEANFALVGAPEDRGLGLEAKDAGAPPKVGLQNLPDVHPARHA